MSFVLGLLAAGFVPGLLIRRWWVPALPIIPLPLWLIATIGGWSEADHDGATGADWFLLGAALLVIPAVGACLGVALGSTILPPPHERGEPS